MRFVPIERVEHGMMLAKSIYDYETRTLLREGKLLSDEIIVRVRERGIPWNLHRGRIDKRRCYSGCHYSRTA